MKGLVEQGSRVAFSLRAQGNVHPDPIIGATIVESPIQICTYDWVVNPSHDKAFLEKICEDTYASMIKPEKYATKTLALCESARIFDEGQVLDVTPTERKVVDYAASFSKKIKPLNEMYIYDENDVPTLSEDNRFFYLNNSESNETKKVMLEDYILKDIRSKLREI
jgi:hypothetical protein